jgi:hypothetical protein
MAFMLNPSNVDFCSEYFLFEKAVEVHTKIGGAERQFRIEALHAPESVIPYTARCYVRVDMTIAPDPDMAGALNGNPQKVSVWALYDLPSAATNSADTAIEHALGLLRERSSR